jgi:hypothetical protein
LPALTRFYGVDHVEAVYIQCPLTADLKLLKLVGIAGGIGVGLTLRRETG